MGLCDASPEDEQSQIPVRPLMVRSRIKTSPSENRLDRPAQCHSNEEISSAVASPLPGRDRSLTSRRTTGPSNRASTFSAENDKWLPEAQVSKVFVSTQENTTGCKIQMRKTAAGTAKIHALRARRRTGAD